MPGPNKQCLKLALLALILRAHKCLAQAKRPFRRLTTTPRCMKLTERQKYARLERVGGRNQQFMANSPEEAGRNFARLVADAAGQNEFSEGQQLADDIETNVRGTS